MKLGGSSFKGFATINKILSNLFYERFPAEIVLPRENLYYT